MSSANIVDLNARRPTPEAGELAQRLLASARDLSAHGLKAALQQAFTEVDDTLFEMSEKTNDGALKQQYFDDLRTLRRTREGAADRFDAALRGAFSLYLHGRSMQKDAGRLDSTADELSLVDESELELGLAITRIATRCDDGVGRPRLELTRRLQHLLQRGESDILIPLSGSIVAEAVRAGLTNLPIGLDSRLVLLKRIERHLADATADAIQDSNKLLFEAGILPELKLTHVRRAGAEATPAQAPPPAGADGAAAIAPQIDLGALANEITKLLTASRPRAAIAEGSGTVELDATTVDQRLGQIADPGTVESEQFGADLRRMLTTDANGKPINGVLSEQVENAIDLVSLMFDFVARDDSLPKEVQQALTPLRVPLLRTALRGAHVFDRSDHPLRALMESAAEVGRSWSPTSDRDGRVLEQIKSAVAAAVAENDAGASADTGVERVHQDLRAFMATEQKRAQLLEKRSAEAAQAQERRLSAQRTSQQVIAEVVEHTPVPPVVGTLLNGPLRRHLELILTRRGEDSKDWKSARKLVRDLVWSFDPVTIEVERSHWQAMLPTIVNAMRGALSSVGMHDNDIDGVVQEFRNRYKDLLGAIQTKPGSSPETFARIDAEHLPDAPPPQVEAEAEAPSPEVIEKAADAGITYSDALNTVRGMANGQWVEISDPQKGETQRAKLIWNSATTQRSLFVNRNGQLVADLSWHRVATDIMIGHVKTVDQGPLFERALVAVKRRLEDAQTKSRAA